MNCTHIPTLSTLASNLQSEIESKGSIAFLDTKATRQEDGSITVSVHRKATNTDRYLDFKSHHQPQHKHSVVRTFMNRAKNIPSTGEEVTRETKQVAKALAAKNYPVDFIHNVRQLNRQQEMNDTDQREFVILPYVRQRILRESRKSSSTFIMFRLYLRWIFCLKDDIHFFLPRERVPCS